jgi:hypothetical protein
MSRGFLLSSIICLVSIVPSVVGSAVLVPRLSTASCSGHFENISVTSITCDGSSDCTYGSQVFVTGQGMLRKWVTHYGGFNQIFLLFRNQIS